MSARLAQLLAAGLRTIEVGARDLDLAEWIVANGHGRFLCLATPEALVEGGAAGARVAALGRHVQPFAGLDQLGRNNGDLLIVSGPLARVLWTTRHYRHARYVAWRPTLDAAAVTGALGALASVLRRRATLVGLDRITLADGRRVPLVLLELGRRRAPRRYISPVLGVDGFFDALNRQGVRYVIMRWFEELPAVQAGCDIDILVADDDVARVDALLEDMPGTIPCGLYSVSGLPGTDHLDMAFFPPALAAGTLARAAWWRERYRVPAPRDYFLGLAFHVAYHKGSRTGVPLDAATPAAAMRGLRHDYLAKLRALAEASGIEVELTLEGLDRCLAAEGWRPPNDMLGRLARANAWLGPWLADRSGADEARLPGLAVFFIRQIACDLGLVDEIVDDLRARGFEVLWQETLDPAARDRVRDGARGGNWGRGPWRRSGGEPAVALVAVDPSPMPPGPEVLRKYPALANARLLAKEEIRNALNRRLPADQHCNMLHSSDNTAQAIEYLEMSLPDRAERILAAARERLAGLVSVSEGDA